ncbi:uncharacterized protein EKO05_0002731 [Ascochyta rabiei]|uniref:Hydrolase n=1 Tax=Didymella rabiei TaxID=5454 RepID=A0A163M0C1_DIDRA|nr:uncharacterized protein EKO05_0002731 [Ascochyta rabiei]KZM28285.1 hydrolase [Ascochyta rabiei]UPX12165.1 hypothetical protein EKO05_0002731 [Ascochyta rabiei]
MTAAASQRWVAAWFAPPSRMLSMGLVGRKLRQIVRVHASGQAVRLRLSNRYGDEPITLADVSVATSVHGPMVGKKSAQVLFNRQTQVILEPGSETISDPVPIEVEAFDAVAISFHLVKGEALTGHLVASQTSYVSSPEVAMKLPAELAFVEYPMMTNSWWLITGLDVMPMTPLNAVVAFGSSTTDGAGSTTNTNGRWPDYLAYRLKEAGGTQYMAVINAGLSGNQLTSSESVGLRNLPAGTRLPNFMFGDSGLRRYEWDVAPQSGATDLIIHIGSNDLRADVPAAKIIEAYKQVVLSARKTYKRVFGTTILPGGFSTEQSRQRQNINDWMLEDGKQLFDSVFDLGTPLRAETDHAKLNPAYDSGDGIHPNNAGYKVMADAIDINKLSGNAS